MKATGTASAAIPSTTPRAGRSFSVRSGSAALPRWKAPRNAWASDARMRHSVQAAPTSIAPTAIGRIWLYQMVKTSSPSGGAPGRRPRARRRSPG